eukprot:IDg14917t1
MLVFALRDTNSLPLRGGVVRLPLWGWSKPSSGVDLAPVPFASKARRSIA